MSIKVAKFGGTSLADAAQFRKVAGIIQMDGERRYVIPSAPGKRHSKDTKVTDMLYSCCAAVHTESFDEHLNAIMCRYNDIIKELSLALSLDSEFSKIRSDLQNGAGRDYAASRGEYLSGIILASFLGFPFVDAASVIFFDERGLLDGERSYRALSELAEHTPYAVIPGFYGSLPDGSIKTFSRGGSDITGSVVSRGVHADLYENWTDVSGSLVADPRIIENPRVIDVISFRELRELSYMGATVLHEDAVFPVRAAGIPINIRNTNRPEDPGTMIVASQESTGKPSSVTGIAGKRGFSVITLEKDMMNQEVGFARRALSAFENHHISFEHLPSGIDTMGIVVNTEVLNGKAEKLLSEIKTNVNPDSIDVVNGLALIAVVGHGMVKTKGIAARVFYSIAKADINIRLIDQGSSELNIIIGVDETDFEAALKAIYNEFFTD